LSNNKLQWTADEPDAQSGYCGHQAKAWVGIYVISPSVTFGSLVRYRVAYMPTGTESKRVDEFANMSDEELRQYVYGKELDS
jgi:hypothetical protein